MGKGAKKHRHAESSGSYTRNLARILETKDGEPAATTGATKAKEKCCRSAPRCKGCPVVLMRTARLQESGLTGKDLKKAVKRARAA